MDEQGSARAARARLSQMQAIRQKKQFEQYQQSTHGADASDRSARAGSNINTQTHQELQQQLPQWPLAPALAPRHIVTAALHSQPVMPDQIAYGQMQPPAKSSKRSLQPSAGHNKDVQPAKPQRKRSLTPKSNSASTSRKSSQASVGSLGSIPDFPIARNSSSVPEKSVPRPQMAPRSQQTYYTQFAVVSPIVEERGSSSSIKSYASSNVIPQRMTEFFYDGAFSDEDSNPRTPYKSSQSPKVYLESKTYNSTTALPKMPANISKSKPLPVPAEAILNNTERPTLMRLPSTQYEPAHTFRHVRGTDLGKGSDAASSLRRAPPSLLGDRVGTKRPPNLEFEKPKTVEARGSMTSLPDLIWRATKVRSNLDRGKTASRLGAEWALAARNAALAEQKRQQNMMPSPGPSTPRTDWPSGNSGKDDYENETSGSRWSRRTIVVLFVLFLLLVALAIIIPVVTIVIPKNQAKAAAVSRAASCIRAISCANGGLATQMPSGACACTCVDGFSGATCDIRLDSVCTSVAIDGGITMLGASVPPLIKVANGYNIPLDFKLLSTEFKKANLTCANENTLITLPALGLNTAGQSASAQVASTINGIVVAGSPTPTANAAGSASTTAAAAAALVTSVPMSIGPGTNSSAQDFAKIGILFVLQDSRMLDMATRAQQSLASFIDSTSKNGTTRAAAVDVALGNGYSINMWDFALKTRNGTVYGKKA